jgi:hypothetical protein
MPRPQDDDVAWGPAPTDRRRPGSGGTVSAGPVTRRTLTLAGGFVLAVAATLAVFLTENPKYLQLAVIVMAWAFVLAAFAAGRRGSDRATAAARETQLRQAYELELEREVAARREYELDLEHDLRREAEEAMRTELDAVRAEIASLGRLRDEVARVSDLRHDLADLSALRDDLARVAALRDDLAALSSLRQDLGQLAELRADMGRLRAELTEQLSSEMLIERIVMRTQGGRLDQARPDVAGHPLDMSATWSDDTPPRELTGGWPAVRLDDPRDLRHAEQVHADRSLPSRHTPPPLWSTGPGTPAFPAAAPTPPASTGAWSSTFDRPASPPPVSPAPNPQSRPWDQPRPWDEPAAESRSWDEPRPWERDTPAAPPSPSTELRPSPAPRPSPRPTPPPPSARLRPDLPPLTRRVDDVGAGPSTAERPVAGAPPVSPADSPREDGPPPSGGSESDSRLAEILAENGVSPSTGGRRRRRYREDGESDDVLARVLGLG